MEKTVKIFNIMLSKGQGGIEQAFLHYSQHLHGKQIRLNSKSQKIEIINIIAHQAFIKKDIPIKQKIFPLNTKLGKVNFIAWIKLAKLLRQEQPHFIFCHGNRANYLGRLALKFSRIKNCRLIGIAHRYHFQELIKMPFVFAISKDIEENLRTLGQNAITYIPNMADANIKPISRILNPSKPLILGMMGRLLPVKGVDIFIDMAHILLKQYGLNVKCLIGGEGAEYANLKARIKKYNIEDQVQLLGLIEDKQAFYDGLDILIVPSRAESFGLMVLEAMQNHLPIIATQNQGCASLIDDHHSGLLVPLTGNIAQSLANSVIALSNDPMLYEKLIMGGKKAVEPYQPKSIAKKIIQTLEKTN